jgi:hypothetical protein
VAADATIARCVCCTHRDHFCDAFDVDATGKLIKLGTFTVNW